MTHRNDPTTTSDAAGGERFADLTRLRLVVKQSLEVMTDAELLDSTPTQMLNRLGHQAWTLLATHRDMTDPTMYYNYEVGIFQLAHGRVAAVLVYLDGGAAPATGPATWEEATAPVRRHALDRSLDTIIVAEDPVRLLVKSSSSPTIWDPRPDSNIPDLALHCPALAACRALVRYQQWSNSTLKKLAPKPASNDDHHRATPPTSDDLGIHAVAAPSGTSVMDPRPPIDPINHTTTDAYAEWLPTQLAWHLAHESVFHHYAALRDRYISWRALRYPNEDERQRQAWSSRGVYAILGELAQRPSLLNPAPPKDASGLIEYAYICRELDRWLTLYG